LFSYETPGTISSAPVVAEGRIYFGSGLSYLATTPGRDFYVLSLNGRGEGDGPGPGEGTTFSAIYDDIIVDRHTTSSCHGKHQGTCCVVARRAYANLVGAAAGPPAPTWI
jgi:hypothetical protein